MSVSVAQLNYNVYQGLGQPDRSLCDVNDIHYAVRNALALLTGQVRSTDNNQLLGVSNELSAASSPALSSPYDITDELEMTTPAWVEIYIQDRWKILKIVNRTRLEQFRRQGLNVCAFYGLESDGNATQYIEFNFDPSQSRIRIWYDHDQVLSNLDAVALMPDNLTILIELMAQNRVITLIKTRIAQSIESEEQKKLLEAQIKTWSDLYAHNMIEIEQWKTEFRKWKNRSRSAQSTRNLPRRSSKGFFGR